MGLFDLYLNHKLCKKLNMSKRFSYQASRLKAKFLFWIRKLFRKFCMKDEHEQVLIVDMDEFTTDLYKIEQDQVDEIDMENMKKEPFDQKKQIQNIRIDCCNKEIKEEPISPTISKNLNI